MTALHGSDLMSTTVSETRRSQAEAFLELLKAMGYTDCFFLPGGNIMHLLNAARTRFHCTAFSHEHSAVVAAEYFNQIASGKRAFALVTAGPGLTNSITAIAGAFTEKRELLVVGGQVKSSDLAYGELRQLGIQEVDGIALAAPITVDRVRIDGDLDIRRVAEAVASASDARGPVFIEWCLDAQARIFEPDGEAGEPRSSVELNNDDALNGDDLENLHELLQCAERPVLLLGGGVEWSSDLPELLARLGIPFMTTYNGADRADSRADLYFGRPNTWGMRYSNIVVGHADLIVALGTRLGMQQTGFNWRLWAPSARVVQVDRDQEAVAKSNPMVDRFIKADALSTLRRLAEPTGGKRRDRGEWASFCQEARASLPLSESVNSRHEGFHNPYDFYIALASVSDEQDVVIPSSSGSAFTVFYQAFESKFGQRILSNKCLASMGYALAGALGAHIATAGIRRTIHIEGDGSILQNIQEFVSVALLGGPFKSFLWTNNGYASIRMTQANYFDGSYLGCDAATGLGFPNWETLFASFGLRFQTLRPGFEHDEEFLTTFRDPDPMVYEVPIHPEQTYFPKIGSRVTEDGSMESSPLWQIGPALEGQLHDRFVKPIEQFIQQSSSSASGRVQRESS